MLILILTAATGISLQAQILYKVEKKGSDKTGYILGTHHFAPLAVIDSISQLPEIIRNTDRLYGEFDMSQMNDPDIMMDMQKYLIAPADSTVDKVLSPNQLYKLSSAFKKITGNTMLVETLYGMKPAVLSTQIAAMMAQKCFPELNPAEGIDFIIQKRAKEAGKEVDGLETLEYQMNLLYNRPISLQAEELMEAIDDLESLEDTSRILCSAYLNHDLASILEIMDEEEDESEMYRMVYERNINWIEILSKEMLEKSIMVVAGAAHLPGEKGILEGLRKKGFIISPVI
ncbi:MAG: TraB/GumN family protein [Muribaculaceae bacterium]|nr:TraB/GumN family protein [Muribaculaceae bacterium]